MLLLNLRMQDRGYEIAKICKTQLNIMCNTFFFFFHKIIWEAGHYYCYYYNNIVMLYYAVLDKNALYVYAVSKLKEVDTHKYHIKVP